MHLFLCCYQWTQHLSRLLLLLRIVCFRGWKWNSWLTCFGLLCDWCLSNHPKHAFTKFYSFPMTSKKKVDLILIYKSQYKYLIYQEIYIWFYLTWMHLGLILIWNHFLMTLICFKSKKCDLLQFWLILYSTCLLMIAIISPRQL